MVGGANYATLVVASNGEDSRTDSIVVGATESLQEQLLADQAAEQPTSLDSGAVYVFEYRPVKMHVQSVSVQLSREG